MDVFFDPDRIGFYDETGRSMGPAFFRQNFRDCASFEQRASAIHPVSEPARPLRPRKPGTWKVKANMSSVRWQRAPKGNASLDPMINLPDQRRHGIGSGSISRASRRKARA